MAEILVVNHPFDEHEVKTLAAVQVAAPVGQLTQVPLFKNYPLEQVVAV